ncbi:unnamed protein product [Oncorhynchus mykiss]|uniref:XK-related protein n=1 Tax=Oncorhynchus mykiss TaxID=8022 RepID=A0A060YRB6_ONCMY|nr:unnamed protein product [Oncorhynchus mykiss]
MDNLVPGVSCLVPVWYQVCPVWYQVCPVWYQVCPVWYQVCPVWYQVCPVWYKVCPVYQPVPIIVTLSASTLENTVCVSVCRCPVSPPIIYLCVCLSTVIYCFVYYLWVGHNYCYAHWAGLTALFLLPGWGPQLLSWLWYQADGRIRSKDLKWTHILHLGIFRRLWETMTSAREDQCSEIMQQADVSALRLLEALVVTLPQTVLQTYVLICTDVGLSSPGMCLWCLCCFCFRG